MKKITVFLITLFFINTLCAQPTEFQKTYGGSAAERAWSVSLTSDGGYIIAGETNSVGAGSYDAFLTRTDAFGTVLWTRTYGGTGWDWANMVKQTSDGGFIVVGGTESAGNGLGDIWIFKTTGLGIVSWQITCGTSGGDSGNDIIQTSDGGYLAAGFQNDPAASSDNACLVKLDGSGTVQWVRTYSAGANDDYANSVAETTGGYIVAGEIDDNVNFTVTALVIRTDASGSVLWANTYGSTDDYWINCVVAMPNGYAMVAGGSSQVSAFNGWLAKLNPNGNPVWSNTYEGINVDNCLWLTLTSDGGFALCGRSNSFSIDYDAFLIKTDSAGAPEWSKRYGGTANDRANQVVQTWNGGYAMASNSLSFGPGESAYLLKTDASGSSGCNESTPAFLMSNMITVVSNVNVTNTLQTNSATSNILFTTQTLTETSLCFTVGENEYSSAEDLILLYPNPAFNEFRIQNSELKIEKVEIYNAAGEKIFSQQPAANNRQQEINIDIQKWNNGIYLVRIKTEQGFSVKKLIKQ